SKLDIGEIESEYPLENDSIPENFNDDLADIPFLHRAQLSKLYRFDLQARLNQYSDLVPVLQKNSQARIEADKNYQSFLTELEKEEPDVKTQEEFGHNDLQSMEAVNVMKDLVLLLRG
ncbi:hypothetical protein SCG7109_AV_00130, partial [Chlamydiales bacterium SCGC AG-110-M15]